MHYRLASRRRQTHEGSLQRTSTVSSTLRGLGCVGGDCGFSGGAIGLRVGATKSGFSHRPRLFAAPIGSIFAPLRRHSYVSCSESSKISSFSSEQDGSPDLLRSAYLHFSPPGFGLGILSGFGLGGASSLEDFGRRLTQLRLFVANPSSFADLRFGVLESSSMGISSSRRQRAAGFDAPHLGFRRIRARSKSRASSSCRGLVERPDLFPTLPSADFFCVTAVTRYWPSARG